jgi:hypothetical protein
LKSENAGTLYITDHRSLRVFKSIITNLMIRKFILFGILIFSGYAYAQPRDVKATSSDKSELFSAISKKDLAHLRDNYMLTDDNYVEGPSKNRIPGRDGKLINTNHQSSMTVSENDCLFSRRNKPYSITNSRYVSRSTITKSINPNNGVRIRIMQNGTDNLDIEDFYLAYESGNEYRMGNTYGIENTSLPLYVKVTYRSWNVFHSVQFDVTYEFVIYFPGTWDVTIFN